MCWLCAHHVIVHTTPLHEAMTAECECLPSDVYPKRVMQTRALEYERGIANDFAPIGVSARRGRC